MTMKSPDELNALKEELEALNKKLAELSEEELQQVAGGVVPSLSGYGGRTYVPGFQDSRSHL